MNRKIAVLFGSGVEEAELFITIDVLKRLNLNINLISVDNKLEIKTNNNNKIITNSIIDNFKNFDEFDSIFIPGGLNSVESILKNKTLVTNIKKHYDKKKIIAAICAAPLVLDTFNEDMFNITLYPTLKDRLIHINKYINNKIIIDHNIITGNGVGNTFEFAFAYAHLILNDKKMIDDLMDKMLYIKE